MPYSSSKPAAKMTKKAPSTAGPKKKIKKPLSAYFHWMNENREHIKAQMPISFGGGLFTGQQFARYAGLIWGAMSPAQKAPYEAMKRQDQRRYQIECAAEKSAATVERCHAPVSEFEW